MGAKMVVNAIRTMLYFIFLTKLLSFKVTIVEDSASLWNGYAMEFLDAQTGAMNQQRLVEVT